MTRMERRRRRRRILRIKLATTAAVLALTTASIVALTGGAAETVPEPTPQPPALQAEPVLLVAEHDSTYQPVQMTAEPAQEPEPVEEEDENEKIEAALLEQGYLHEEIPLDFDLQCHLIAVCEEYGVPQNVALGVIQAESSFTATAANGSCYGYMQINSINSEWLSEKIGVTDLTDPYQNIRSGVFILSDLYGKYGDWHKALICYNYGEGGAQEHVFSKGYHKLMRYGGTIDLLCEIGGLLELIDFKTTYTLLEMACGVQLEAYSQALISHGITPQRKNIMHLKKDGKWSFREFPAKDPARCRVVGALKCLYDYEQSYK